MSELAAPAPGPEQQDAPLTEPERKLLVRLFSDPTYFPVEFRTWIKSYLETSDVRLPASAIVGGNVPKVDLPAGITLPFAGGTIPSNCLLCDGSAVDRTEYALLFQAIGTTWGAGNGTSTFNIPDLRDRALYGAGAVVGLGATDGRALGSRGGPRHYHYFSDTKGVTVSGNTGNNGGHGHSAGAVSNPAIYTSDGQLVTPSTGGSGTFFVNSVGDHSHSASLSGNVTISGATSGGYDQDRPSFAGVLYIITTGKRV